LSGGRETFSDGKFLARGDVQAARTEHYRAEGGVLLLYLQRAVPEQSSTSMVELLAAQSCKVVQGEAVGFCSEDHSVV